MMRKFIQIVPVLLLAAGLAVSGAGCSAKAKKAYHLQKADRYFAAGQYDQAEIEYLNVLRSDHENIQAISRLAQIYFDEGRMQRAAPFVFEGCRLATNNLDLNLKAGLIYFAAGKGKEAREKAIFVLDRNPRNDEAAQLLLQTAVTLQALEETKRHFQMLAQKTNSAALQVGLGMIALRVGDLKPAEAAFKQAQALDPKSSAAWLALGVLYLAQTNLPQAESAFKSAAELAPARSVAKLQYANFQLRNGNLAAGRKILEAMVQKTPDYIPAMMALAEVDMAEKKYDDCVAVLNKVLARDPDNLNADLARARVKFAQGKTAEATTDLERLAKINPQVPQVQYLLATAYLAGNDSDKAVKSLTRAIALNPNYPDAVLLLAGLQIKMGNVDPAVASLKQLTQQYPQITQAQLLLAGASRAQGNFGDALTIYRRLEAANPTNSEISMLIGMTFAQQKNNAEARRAFTRALELAPDNFTALQNLVAVDLADHQYSTALQRMQPSLQKYPKLAAPHIIQARIFMASGDTNQATAALSKAVELQPEIATSYMLLARLAMDARQNQKALDLLQIAASKNTNDVSPLLFIGMIHNDEQDYKAARDAYEKLLAMDPKYSPALNNLAYLYAEHLNDLDRAYELALRARSLLPTDPSTADTLGWVLYKRGQYASALSLLQESANQLPNEPDVQFHLGKANYMLGKDGPALQAFRRALQSGKDFTGKDECRQCVAVLEVDVKTAGADARVTLEKRVAQEPNDIIALLKLAAIFQRDGMIDKAVRTYESALQVDSQNLTALINLARLYSIDPKNVPKAFELARAAYKLAPDNSVVVKMLGHLACETGNYSLSFNLLQEIARNETDNPQVQFDFARAAYAMGRIADAEAAMRNVLAAGQNFSGLDEATRFLKLTPLAANSSQAVVAASQIADILKKEPDYVPALMASAVISEQKNDAVAAQRTYEKILSQYPNFSPAQKNLTILYAGSGNNNPKAYELAAKARAAFPDDREVARAYGIILYLHGDYAQAERLLKESAVAINADPEILYYLGMAQYHLKKSADCKKNLQQALNLNLPAQFAQPAKQVLIELK